MKLLGGVLRNAFYFHKVLSRKAVSKHIIRLPSTEQIPTSFKCSEKGIFHLNQMAAFLQQSNDIICKDVRLYCMSNPCLFNHHYNKP